VGSGPRWRSDRESRTDRARRTRRRLTIGSSKESNHRSGRPAVSGRVGVAARTRRRRSPPDRSDSVGPPHGSPAVNAIKGAFRQGFAAAGASADRDINHPGIVSSIQNLIDPLHPFEGFLTEPAISLADSLQKVWRPDLDEPYAAQALAENNAAHWIPFDPQHVPSAAEQRATERDLALLVLGHRFGPQVGEISVRPAGPFGRFKSAEDFELEAYRQLQRFHNEAFAKIEQSIRTGSLTPPPGLPQPLFFGKELDAAVRNQFREWVRSEGIEEGPTGVVRINRRLYDQTAAPGAKRYRQPDVYVPQANSILEGTMAPKSWRTPQIRDYRAFSGANTTVVRPQARGTSYGVVQ